MPAKFQAAALLVKKPVIPSPDSVTYFKRHESGNGLHSFFQGALTTFLNNYSGKTEPINAYVNNVVKQQVNENRAVLFSLIDSVILCGHLGLPLRGHRDDSFYHPEAGDYAVTSGVGNFIEVVNFAIRRGDSTLKHHYKNHKKNVSYLSKTTQNELIKFCIFPYWLMKQWINLAKSNFLLFCAMSTVIMKFRKIFLVLCIWGRGSQEKLFLNQF